MNFWGADAPQKFMRGAYIINEFFFATCDTKIRRIFYPPKSVIVLRQFGWIFWGANAPQKIIRGAYIINEVISPLVVQRYGGFLRPPTTSFLG